MELSQIIQILPEQMSFLAGLPLAVIFMVVGIGLLVMGGNWTVDSAVFVAKRFGISPLIVGFTIVAFGTSLPELVISVFANLEGSAGIALGNVMGSNIANILLVIGVAAAITPLVSGSKAIHKDLAMMMFATCILAGLLMVGEFPRWAGGAMVLILMGYVFYQYKMAQSSGALPEAAMEDEPEFSKPAVAYGLLLLGLAAIAVGAELLVTGARESAGIIGVPDAVIALSIIAIGTSLPELSTSIIAVRKGHSGLVLGNIIGSNVFNILMIVGITALVKPIAAGTFAPQLVNFDIWLVALTSSIFALMILYLKKITRVAGFVFCGAYIAYNIYIYAIYV